MEMLVKMNNKILKKVIEVRPIYCVAKNHFSLSNENTQNGNSSQSSGDIFKYYNEVSPDFSAKYRPLEDKDYQKYFSSRSLTREPALTRLITSLAYKVGKKMLSLAEGMPNENVFPFTKLRLETRSGNIVTMEGKELAAALQYLPSQGLPALLETLQQFQQSLHHPPPHSRGVIVTNGSQHGIYQCIELLMEPGDSIITSEYTYPGVFIALKPYNAEIIGIPEDSDGIDPNILENNLATRLSQGLKMPKVLYVIPTGNNPTGSILSEERRRRIYELACQYDFLILEDDPYMFLNYTEKAIPSFLSMDACGRVIRMDSLSKVVSAGLRAGWLTAPRRLIERIELQIQAELLHSNTLSQAIQNKLLSDQSSLGTHLSVTQLFYRRRRDALQRALLRARIDELADWHVPNAGLFLWLRVRGVDDVYNMVFDTALKRGLMLVPGQAFMCDTRATSQYLRLTFSKIPMEQMDAAAGLLADIIREEQQQTSRPRHLATEW